MNKLLITLCASLLTLNTYAGLCESREAATQRKEATAQRDLEEQMLFQTSIEMEKLRTLARDHKILLNTMPTSPNEALKELDKQKIELLASLKTLNTYENRTRFQKTIEATAKEWLVSENVILLAYRLISPDEDFKKNIENTVSANHKMYEEEIKGLLAISPNK